jgi:hypothetical protein
MVAAALMMGLLFMEVRALVNPSAPTSETAGGAQKVIVRQGLFGCQDRQIFERIGSYAVDKDTAVFTDTLAQALMQSECVFLKQGTTELFVTDTAIFHGLIKIREKGDTTEYWTNLEAVGDAPAQPAQPEAER